MNVLLIQPPDIGGPVKPAGTYLHRLTLPPPSWDLLCLRSYILERTRHACTFIDCRLYVDLEANLVEALRNNPGPHLLVIETTTVGLGQAMAVLEIAKRHFPSARTALCGQHPTAFPEHAARLPRVDFALSGDAEPILRNLLDYIDIQQRLLRIPGLLMPQRTEPVEPYWAGDLRSLSLPDWQGVFWPGYQSGGSRTVCRADLRLTRGHSRCPADRAFGGYDQPLRVWPFERAATTLFKSAHAGITEVFVSDPPGFWTPDNLRKWCTALLQVRNTQSWSLNLLPTYLDDDTLADLECTSCKRVEFIYPSSEPEVLKKYGCTISPSEMGVMAELLARSNIETAFRFWVGGPESTPDEEAALLRTLRAIGFRKYLLEPFPFQFDTPLYRVYNRLPTVPQMAEWIQWSMDPWLLDKPVPLWGGKEEAGGLETVIRNLHSAIQHSPLRLIAGLLRKVYMPMPAGITEESADGTAPAKSA